MKSQFIVESPSGNQEFLEKIGAGEHKQHPSFDMADEDFEGRVTYPRCINCKSERIQVMSQPPGRRIRCLECGHEEWD